jgi:hypothetical protein
MASSRAGGFRPTKVGLVDIPDVAIGLLESFLRSPRFEVCFVIDRQKASMTSRLCRKLGLRVTETANGEMLKGCDLLITAGTDASETDALRREIGSNPIMVMSLQGAIRWFIRSGDGPDFGTHGMGDARTAKAKQVTKVARRCDLRNLLGHAMSSTPFPVEIDGADPRLLRLLDRISEIAGAASASIMLLDADARYLQVVGAGGPRGDRLTGARARPGEGIAGQAYLTGEPIIVQRPMPILAEHPDPWLYRIGVSIPLSVDGRPYGVLSVNLDSSEEIHGVDRLIGLLERKSREAARVILGAICVNPANSDFDGQVLREVVDRLMSLDENRLTRLGGVTEALAKGLRAERYRLLVVDRPTMTFQRVSLDSDLCLELERCVPADRGLLRWIMDHGKARILELEDEPSGDRFTSVFVPLRSPRTDAIILMEGVQCPHDARSRGIEMLADIAHCVEEMLVVEENVSDRDFVSELEMRIADEARDLEFLPPEECVDRVLKLALRLLAADHAAWVPHPGGTPVIASAAGAELGPSKQMIQESLRALSDWVLSMGYAHGGPGVGPAPPEAPESPVPFAGVRDRTGRGALLTFYSAHDLGAFHQVGGDVLTQALGRLGDLIAPRGTVCEKFEEPSRDEPPELVSEGPSDAKCFEDSLKPAVEARRPWVKILLVESGGAKAGIPWDEVRGVGAHGMSVPRVGPGASEPPSLVSLSEVLGVLSGAEHHAVLISDDRANICLTCERLGGLVGEEEIRDQAQTDLPILSAADLADFPSKEGRAA